MKELGFNGKYWSAIAMVFNIWREHARAIFSIWKLRWGNEAAVTHSGTMPPKCISGRWGAVSVCEDGPVGK